MCPHPTIHAPSYLASSCMLYVSSYYYTCPLMLLCFSSCMLYVSSYYYTCTLMLLCFSSYEEKHRSMRVQAFTLMLLCVSSYTLMLFYVFLQPHASMFLLIHPHACYMCPHPTIHAPSYLASSCMLYVSSSYYTCTLISSVLMHAICVLILLYMHPHASMFLLILG
jgi:hypothetical protein